MEFLNAVILSGFVEPGDIEALFPKGEDVVSFKPEEADIFGLLVKLGAFPSKTQARKNWKGPEKIPEGWSEFKVGKLRRHLCIWNPNKRISDFEDDAEFWKTLQTPVVSKPKSWTTKLFNWFAKLWR